MAKITDARLAVLQAYFNASDVITEANMADLALAIQEAAQDHEHSAAGGPGSGTGDATLANAGQLQGYDLGDTAPALNDLLRYSGDPVRWRPDGPFACRAYNNAALSIPNNAWTLLTFNSERFDSHNIHSTTLATGRLYAHKEGPYQVTTHFNFAANPVGQRGVRILLNANVIDTMTKAGAGVGATYLELTTLWWATAGQYFRVQVYQNSGAALDVQFLALLSPEFMLARVP